jgi:predicted XRE-type DNA-binding protein
MKAYENVWDAIEASPEAAASMEARATIMMAVQKIVRAWQLPQHAAARKLDISQPRLNDLLRGKIDKFSLDALFDLGAHAGLRVSVKLKRVA